MDAVKRIARNTVSLSIAEFIGRIGHFLIFVYIARLMGKVIFGTFNFAYSFSLIAIVFADIGINYMLVREIAKRKEAVSAYVGNSFIIKAALSALTFMLIFIISRLANFSGSTSAIIYLLFGYMAFRSFCELLFTIFRAYEDMHYESAIKIINTIVLAGLASCLIYKGYGLIAVSAAYLVVQLLVFIATYFIIIRKFAAISFRFDLGTSRYIIKKASPFILGLLFASIYFYIDSILLSFMRGDAEVGLYSAAYNITLAILIIPGMYTNAIYPLLSKKFGSDSGFSRETAKFIYERSFKYLYFLGLPITVGIYSLAPRIIHIIYGGEYAGSVAALQLLSWYVFIKYLGFLTGIILSSMDKQHLRAGSQGFAAIANIAANLMLIPKYGIIGAGISTLLSEIILFVSSYMFVTSNFHKVEVGKFIFKPILPAILIYAMSYLELNIFLSIFLGAFIYAACLLPFRPFDRKDWGFIKRLLPFKEFRKEIDYA